MQDDEFDFHSCIEIIRSKDALTYEEGYLLLVDKASLYVDELIALVKGEDDPYTRGKFVELLGETRSPKALSALAEELNHPDQNVRQWAVTGLNKLDLIEADELVKGYEKSHPDEYA